MNLKKNNFTSKLKINQQWNGSNENDFHLNLITGLILGIENLKNKELSQKKFYNNINEILLNIEIKVHTKLKNREKMFDLINKKFAKEKKYNYKGNINFDLIRAFIKYFLNFYGYIVIFWYERLGENKKTLAISYINYVNTYKIEDFELINFNDLQDINNHVYLHVKMIKLENQKDINTIIFILYNMLENSNKINIINLDFNLNFEFLLNRQFNKFYSIYSYPQLTDSDILKVLRDKNNFNEKVLRIKDVNFLKFRDLKDLIEFLENVKF